ncbi:hypothetical protein FRC01_013218, partial [Tulasnella sp. 417]
VMTECIPYSKKLRDTAIILEMEKRSPPGSIGALGDLLASTNVDPACHTGVTSLQLIILQCWDFDPTERPSSAIIVRDIAAPSNKVRKFIPGRVRKDLQFRLDEDNEDLSYSEPDKIFLTARLDKDLEYLNGGSVADRGCGGSEEDDEWPDEWSDDDYDSAPRGYRRHTPLPAKRIKLCI